MCACVDLPGLDVSFGSDEGFDHVGIAIDTSKVECCVTILIFVKNRVWSFGNDVTDNTVIKRSNGETSDQSIIMLATALPNTECISTLATDTT